MIRIIPKHDFEKQQLVEIVAKHFRHSQEDFAPFMVTAGDPSSWILDSGNNWRLTFKPQDPSYPTAKAHIVITFRYSSRLDNRADHFAHFLAAQYGWELQIPIYRYDLEQGPIWSRAKLYEFEWVSQLNEVPKKKIMSQAGFDIVNQIEENVKVLSVKPITIAKIQYA